MPWEGKSKCIHGQGILYVLSCQDPPFISCSLGTEFRASHRFYGGGLRVKVALSGLSYIVLRCPLSPPWEPPESLY